MIIKEQKELTKIEKEALEICRSFQYLTKNIVGINLTDDIRENSKHLVLLYKMKEAMEDLRNKLPKHEVIDKRTGKVFGELYDNEYVESVMLSTNIRINSGIQHTEWYIRKINCAKLIINENCKNFELECETDSGIIKIKEKY